MRILAYFILDSGENRGWEAGAMDGNGDGIPPLSFSRAWDGTERAGHAVSVPTALCTFP